MENENLSNAFIQKYDPLSDSFVVVENLGTKEEKHEISQSKRKFEPFSFFRGRNKTLQSDENFVAPLPNQNQGEMNPPPIQTPNNTQNPNMPPRPPMPQPAPPKPAPPANQSVVLSIEAYNKLKILGTLYQSLLATDSANAETYNSLINETLILQNTMLSIYQTLSGNNNIPAQNQTAPIMIGERCRDLATTDNYLQSTINTVLSLQRAVNVANINRQLAIISTTLLSQRNQLSTLQVGCD